MRLMLSGQAGYCRCWPRYWGCAMTPTNEAERLRRWRLVLGRDGGEGMGGGGMSGAEGTGDGDGFSLSGTDLGMDGVLEALYDGERSAGLGGSSPRVARWLGGIRTYFPTSVVRVMQQDALQRLNLTQMLLEPEM